MVYSLLYLWFILDANNEGKGLVFKKIKVRFESIFYLIKSENIIINFRNYIEKLFLIDFFNNK